jgi:hypothetical protein
MQNIKKRCPMRAYITPMNRISKFTKLYAAGNAQQIIFNLLIFIVITLVYVLSGCSLSHYGGKSPIQIEQSQNPETWKEVYKMQATLWPLEMKVNEIEKKVNNIEKTVNEIKDELATTKLSSLQANKTIESLQAEMKQKKSESTSKEKTSMEVIRPVDIKNNKEVLKMETAKVAGESKKVSQDLNLKIINDIKYSKISETQDKVLVYVNALNNPKLQRLIGERPRIVVDFFNTRNMDKEKYEINTDGNFIKRIRIRSYQEPLQKVRIVFDMAPNKKYSVERTFSKKENIYSFSIKAN